MLENRERRRARRLARQRSPSQKPVASIRFAVVFALLGVAVVGLWSGSTVEKTLYASGHNAPALSTQPRLLPAPVVIYTPTPSR